MTDTGIALIDLPAKDIAGELADDSWADRAKFFNNALCESLETIPQLTLPEQTKPEDL